MPEPPTASVVGLPLAVQLAAAANRGLDETLGRDRNPLVSGSATNLVEAVQAHGMPIAWAVQAVYEAARRCTRQPRSLQYFTPGLVDLWTREEARRAADGFTPGTPITEPIQRARATEPSVRVGPQVLTRTAFWELCVRNGLTTATGSVDTQRERIRAMQANGQIADAEAFQALVQLVQPWVLVGITFAKDRDTRLDLAFARWNAGAQGAA